MGSDDLFKKRKLAAQKALRRKTDLRAGYENILIVCEGEKTEPNYFCAFSVKTANLEVYGEGLNTKSLIRFADKRVKEAERKSEYYDQVWCVFDKDSFSDEKFNTAIQMAEAKRYKVAYSNEAFELWYVLHFEYLNADLPRERYYSILDEKLGFKYEKNNPDMYSILLSRQKTAIRNAETLLNQYNPDTAPSDKKPSTTVHILVLELIKYQ